MYLVFAPVNIILYNYMSRHALHDNILFYGVSVATMSLSHVTVRVSLCMSAISILTAVDESAIVVDVSEITKLGVLCGLPEPRQV